MVIVKEFKEQDSFQFPEEFAAILPDYCDVVGCGYPLEISEVLTGLRCSNPKCPSKVVQRLLAIMTSLGVKGMGEALATKFITSKGFTNPLYILAYEYEADGILAEGYDAVSKSISDQLKDKKTFTVAEYVKLANLPNVQSSAIAVFGKYDSLSDAYADIEEGGVEFITQKLGVTLKEDSVSVKALKVYESLTLFKDDLFAVYPCINVRKVNDVQMVNIKACCSDEVGYPFKTKNDFYSCCNNVSENIHIDFAGSVSGATEYLIWAGADGGPARYTSKVKKAEAHNLKIATKREAGKLKPNEHDIKIITGVKFYELLQGMGS